MAHYCPLVPLRWPPAAPQGIAGHDFRCAASSGLLRPKVSEALGGELGVPGRVLDVAVPEPLLDRAGVVAVVGDAVTEPLLDRAGVVAVVGELVAAAVPEHVRVDGEGEAGPLADTTHELLEAGHAQRARALAGEDVGRARLLLALEAPQG